MHFLVNSKFYRFWYKQVYIYKNGCLISIFRTRKVSHQISNVLSLPVSSSKMVEPFLITTSKRNQPFTWSFVFVVVCKSSSRHSPERPSLWKSKLLTPSKTSKLKFRYATRMKWFDLTQESHGYGDKNGFRSAPMNLK